MAISKSSLSFLTALSNNNSRDWFMEHKSDYTDAQENVIQFADEVLEQLNSFDVIDTASGKKALKRIYRDVRFSKNKSPYKGHFGIGFVRSSASRRGGYYIHIQPGATFIGGGFWGPEKDDLLRIRKHLEIDASELQNVIQSTSFKNHFGTMEGEQLKTAPKGFDKEHPSIELLRYKQFLVGKSFTDKEVLAKDFSQTAANTLKAMLPFFEVMTEMLTTNLNGESLID